MKVSVSGKQLDIGAAFKEHAESELNEHVNKYFDRSVSADVVMTKERHLFVANITVNEGTGTNVMIRGEAKEPDVYAAFDKANERVAKQLRRYKRRIKAHHKKVDRKAVDVTKYVISPEADEELEEEATPLVIAEKNAVIEELSVSDAVMRMDLGNLPAVMFINKKSGIFNVIYKRADGNISWINPEKAL